MKSSMRKRMTVFFVFILAPFLLLSSHILLTLFRNHHMRPGEQPGWPPFVVFTLLSVIFFGFIAWSMIGRTLSPIGDLARQAEEAGADHTGVRLVSPSEDREMVELVDTLNGFLDRMESAAEEKSKFYAAASHELRTPLQALGGHLEVALSQPREAEDYAEALEEAHRQTQRLTSLVDGVLLLHQLEQAQPSHLEPVDFASMLAISIVELTPLMEVKGLRIEIQGATAPIPCRPAHAEILMRNLLENMVRYAPEGALLEVTFAASKISFTNPTESEVDAVAISQPFVRPAGRTSGNGLGLTICRAIVRVYGWSLDIAIDKTWFRATIEFV